MCVCVGGGKQMTKYRNTYIFSRFFRRVIIHPDPSPSDRITLEIRRFSLQVLTTPSEGGGALEDRTPSCPWSRKLSLKVNESQVESSDLQSKMKKATRNNAIKGIDLHGYT